MEISTGKLYKLTVSPSPNKGRAKSSIMIKGTGVVYATNRDTEPTALTDMVNIIDLTDDIGLFNSDLYTYIAITGATSIYIKGSTFEDKGAIS